MKLITREPDRIGRFGKAWRVDLKAVSRHLKRPIGAGMETWFVYAPHSHPLWHNYVIAAVHLRSLPDMPPAKIMLEGATHEVFLYALDPQQEPNFLNPLSTVLTPINFCGQWIAASDIDAAEKIEGCVEDIVHGRLNPDTDSRSSWFARFSDSNRKNKSI